MTNYEINPQFVSAVFKESFSQTSIVLSGGMTISTELSVEDVLKLLNE